MKSIIRSIAAVVGGFVTITVLSLGADVVLMSSFPESFPSAGGGAKHFATLLFALIYSFIFFAIGGYITACAAGRSELQHAFALAMLLLLMSILATIQMYETAPLWWHLAMLIFLVPAVMFGGYWRATRKHKFYPLKA